jgi:ferredoxin-NADP reductase
VVEPAGVVYAAGSAVISVQPPARAQLQRPSTGASLVGSEYEADVRVVDKEVAAEAVVTLVLRAINDDPLPAWEPGAHVDLILPDAPTRQYSLCGDPAERRAYRLAVSRDPNGSGSSTYVHDRLQTGEIVRIRGPRNNFPLVESPRYLFIAGGIGITPLLPMVAAASARDADWCLVYAGRRRGTMAFLGELAAYGDRVVIRPSEETGRPDLHTLLSAPRRDTLVFCCGPERLIAAVEQCCEVWPAQALHVERFTPKSVQPMEADGSFEVVLRRSDLTLTVPPGRSILSVVEEAGIGVVSSCARGTCGTCETRVIEGKPDHRDAVLNQEERAADDCMMICCSRSKGPRLVLDL